MCSSAYGTVEGNCTYSLAIIYFTYTYTEKSLKCLSYDRDNSILFRCMMLSHTVRVLPNIKILAFH
jgi:hypothetical protein